MGLGPGQMDRFDRLSPLQHTSDIVYYSEFYIFKYEVHVQTCIYFFDYYGLVIFYIIPIAFNSHVLKFSRNLEITLSNLHISENWT